MELVWVIYLIDTVSELKSLSIIGIFGLLYAICAFMFITIDNGVEETPEKIPASLKRYKIATVLIASFFIVAFCKLIPSKDTSYKMLAAYGVAEVSKTEGAQKLASKSLQVIEKAMDDYLKETDKK